MVNEISLYYDARSKEHKKIHFMTLTLLIPCIVINLFIYVTNIYTTEIHNNTVLCLLPLFW